jgi:hypothetical protein
VLDSLFQIKIAVLSLFPGSADAEHIYLGLACYIISTTLVRQPMHRFRATFLGLFIILAFEALDWALALSRGAPIPVTQSIEDVAHVMVVPLILVILSRLGWMRR